MISITPRAYPDLTTPITYRDVVVRLSTQWNVREQAWYLSIADGQGVQLISGFKMTQTANVTARNTLAYFDLFDVYVVNDKPNQARPTFDDMGLNIRLAFVDKEETVAIQAEFPNSIIYK